MSVIFVYLIFILILYSIGLYGIIFNPYNLIRMLISIELLLLSSVFSFLIFSTCLLDITGQIAVIMILTVAAVESAIGLALIIVYFKTCDTISLHKINLLSK